MFTWTGSEWKGIEHGRKCELDPAWILGLIVVIWATKFLTAIRLKQKLKKAWDGAPFFRKKDTEESLIDSLTYPAKGQTIDSQVDDQTWHDLALDAVF